jgi:hypothetical protein
MCGLCRKTTDKIVSSNWHSSLNDSKKILKRHLPGEEGGAFLRELIKLLYRNKIIAIKSNVKLIEATKDNKEKVNYIIAILERY